MSHRQVPRASRLADHGPSLVARVGVVVVAILVATSTVAASATVAAPVGGDGTTDPSTERALDTTVPDSNPSTDLTPSATNGPTGDTDIGGTAAQPIDVVFVVDSSQSMNRERYELAGEMREFKRTLLRKDVDARFGLVTYTDEPRVRQRMTNDFSKVEDAMQFQPEGNVERASDALITADGLNFRSDAKTVFVLMTDEDDDSSLETRQQALDTIREHVFVAVSPSDASSSGCDQHFEPCDNSSANELKRYAGQVRGDWIDIDTDAAETMREVSNIAADAAGASTSDEDDSTRIQFEVAPDISVRDTSTNRTTAEVGEMVAVNGTLENAGLSDGTVEVQATTNGRTLQNETVTIESLSERSVSLVHAFEEPGVYSIVLNNERVGKVVVNEIAETNVTIDNTPERNRLVASVSEATAAEPIEIASNSSPLLSMKGAELAGVTVVTERGIARPAHDLAFEMAVEQRTIQPADTSELSVDATAVTYLSVNSTLANSDISSVSFQFANRTSDLTMYRYEPDSEEWTALSKAAPGEENGMLFANTSKLSWFAVAVTGPVVSVESVSTGSTEIAEGDLFSSTVTVKNPGTSERSYDATVSLDGEIVYSKSVTVAAGETAAVDVAYTPTTTGDFNLSVAGTDQGVLVVEPRTDSSEASDDEQEPNTTSPDYVTVTQSEESTTQPDGSTPGPGPLVAILALVLVASLALVRRRHDE